MDVLQFDTETNTVHTQNNNLNPSLKYRFHSVGHLVNKIHPDVKAQISTRVPQPRPVCVCAYVCVFMCVRMCYHAHVMCRVAQPGVMTLAGNNNNHFKSGFPD